MTHAAYDYLMVYNTLIAKTRNDGSGVVGS